MTTKTLSSCALLALVITAPVMANDKADRKSTGPLATAGKTIVLDRLTQDSTPAQTNQFVNAFHASTVDALHQLLDRSTGLNSRVMALESDLKTKAQSAVNDYFKTNANDNWKLFAQSDAGKTAIDAVVAARLATLLASAQFAQSVANTAAVKGLQADVSKLQDDFKKNQNPTDLSGQQLSLIN